MKQPSISPDEHLQYLLQSLFPGVDWMSVRWYHNLPWYISSSKTNGVTLPGIYDVSRIHLYFKNFNPYDNEGLALIIHESFHVMQFSQLGKNGPGFWRPFLYKYLAAYFKYGYRLHPLENEAYQYDSYFTKCLLSGQLEHAPLLESKENIDLFLKEFPELITTGSKANWKVSIPYKAVSILFCTFAAMAIPLLENSIVILLILIITLLLQT